MSTYLQLQDECLNHGFPDLTYRSRFKTWINDYQRRVVRETSLPQFDTSTTLSTVANQAYVELPSDFLRFIALKDTANTQVLDVIAWDEYLELSSTTGTPTYYVIYGSNIYLYPTPDAVYSEDLYYRRAPATLTNDGDIPEIPEAYHPLLISGPLSRAFAATDDENRSAFHTEEFDRLLNEMRMDLHARDETPKQTPGILDW